MRSHKRTIEQRWVDLVCGEPRTLAARAALLGLRLLSLPYLVGLKANLGLYRAGLLRREHMPCPVISVGNLTLGGTGKTSLCATIARYISDAGVPAAILLRGYRRPSREPIVVVSDCQGEIRAGYAEAGDEALMLARQLPGVAVVVGKNRVATGRLACAELGAKALILDDGLSYFRMERNLEIVLIDATRPQDLRRLFPAGMLREPLSHLRRAHLVCLSHTALAPEEDVSRIITEVRVHTMRPIIQGTHRPTYVRRLGSAERQPPTAIAGRKLLCLCGIGNPAAFQRTVERLGAQVVGSWQLPDHGPLDAAGFHSVLQAAEQAEAEDIITTEKDAVRLEAIPGTGRLLVLGVRFTLTSGAAELYKRLEELIVSS